MVDLVRIDVADPRAALDRHVADRHALVHRHALDGVAGILVGEADAAVHAEAPDDFEDHVLGVHARHQAPGHADAAHLQRIHRQALRREHVADLRGADAERHGAECAVRRGVTVAAGDGHPRLRQPQLRPDDVDDPLRAAVQVEHRHAAAAAVLLERRQHVLGHHVAERPPLVARRDDVIDGGDRPLRVLHAQPARPQHVERLRTGDLVDQVQADEELRLPVRQRTDCMEVPDLLEERRGHGGMVLRVAVAVRGPGSRIRSRLAGSRARWLGRWSRNQFASGQAARKLRRSVGDADATARTGDGDLLRRREDCRWPSQIKTLSGPGCLAGGDGADRRVAYAVDQALPADGTLRTELTDAASRRSRSRRTSPKDTVAAPTARVPASPQRLRWARSGELDTQLEIACDSASFAADGRMRQRSGAALARGRPDAPRLLLRRLARLVNSRVSGSSTRSSCAFCDSSPIPRLALEPRAANRGPRAPRAATRYT